MLEDLLELREKLNRLIAKYEKEARVRGDYQFENGTKFNETETDNNLTEEGCWRGNDYY